MGESVLIVGFAGLLNMDERSSSRGGGGGWRECYLPFDDIADSPLQSLKVTLYTAGSVAVGLEALSEVCLGWFVGCDGGLMAGTERQRGLVSRARKGGVDIDSGTGKL